MNKILFIINPISGTGKKKIIERLAPEILGDDFDISFAYTQYPKHAIEISKENSNGYDIITAVGGDGTINEVATGLIGNNCTMAVIPRGSGNGFARFLEIPLTIKGALEVIKGKHCICIDTASINDEYFVNITGIGFDAEIGHKFANYGKRGAISYLKLILQEFKNYKGQNYKLIIDGREIEKEAFLISIANSSQWGLNAHIAPKAVINDGKLDISIVHKFPLQQAIPLSIRLFNKTIHKSLFVESKSAKEIIIKNKSELTAHIDGEPVKYTDDICIKIIPSSLQVIIPKKER